MKAVRIVHVLHAPALARLRLPLGAQQQPLSGRHWHDMHGPNGLNDARSASPSAPA